MLGDMRRAFLILSLLPLPLMSGCVYALRPYNTPSQEKLHVQSSSPTICVVLVAEKERYPVAADGRVTFEVPSLERGCDVYLFGLIKVGDGNPENIPAIHVLREGKVVRKLSLANLGKLPQDTEGYHLLILK
jgi:hypothetical protein